MIVHRSPASVSGIPEKDDVAEAIHHVLREVRATQRDLRMTRFCLQQAEALRRIERAKPALLILPQSDSTS